jgi:hypothetical protein
MLDPTIKALSASLDSLSTDVNGSCPDINTLQYYYDKGNLEAVARRAGSMQKQAYEIIALSNKLISDTKLKTKSPLDA